jgi:hypothetical protein
MLVFFSYLLRTWLFPIFQTSAPVYSRPLLFWDVTQRILAAGYSEVQGQPMGPIFNPLKTKRVCFIEGLSAYRAVNTLHFGYKNQSLNVL